MNITTYFRGIINDRPGSALNRPLRILRSIKRNPIKQWGLQWLQKKMLKDHYPAGTKALIIFVNTSSDIVNGGIISICAHYEETAKMRSIHGAEVILCTPPDDKLLLKYTRFKNDNHLLGFSGVLSYFHSLESLMIHLPEYMVDRFIKDMAEKDVSRLHRIKDVHMNIMLQNIDGLKYMQSIKGLEQFGKVTCTTAHRKYATPGLRGELGVPLHVLSVRGDPGNYNRVSYIEKEYLMIVSPDEHPLKPKILKMICEQFPDMRIQIISNLTYEEYKRTIEKAKWALTFGEGLDGYFTETIFSGGISFSVYNGEYFTEEFRSLRTVYDNYNALAGNICSDMKRLDEEHAFREYQDEQFALCSKYYTYEEYYKNLQLFYKGDYTYK